MYCCMVFWLDLTWMVLVRNSIQGIIPGAAIDGQVFLYKSASQASFTKKKVQYYNASVMISWFRTRAVQTNLSHSSAMTNMS